MVVNYILDRESLIMIGVDASRYDITKEDIMGIRIKL